MSNAKRIFPLHHLFSWFSSDNDVGTQRSISMMTHSNTYSIMVSSTEDFFRPLIDKNYYSTLWRVTCIEIDFFLPFFHFTDSLAPLLVPPINPIQARQIFHFSQFLETQGNHHNHRLQQHPNTCCDDHSISLLP